MRATRLRVGRWRIALAAVVVATTLPFALVSLKALWLTAFVAFLAALILFAAVMAPSDESERAELEVGGDGVRFGEQTLGRGEIRRARVFPHEKYADVELAERWFPIRYRVESAERAREIVAALRLDAGLVRDSFALRPRPLAGFLPAFVLQFAAQFALRAAPAWIVAMGLGLALLTVVLHRMYRLDVGPDGIELRRGWSRVHVQPSAITGVADGETKGHSGELIIYRAGQLPLSFMISAALLPAAKERITELRSMQAADEQLADAARALQRSSLDDLRTLGEQPETFRRFGLDRATLLRILETPSAPPGARARAAIALGGRERERVRIAAENTTIPELRVALERMHDAEHAADDVAEMIADVDQIA